MRMWEAEDDGSRRAAAPGANVAEGPGEAADFGEVFDRLQSAVRAACSGETDWQARVGLGVRAVLDFVAGDPVGARALTDRGDRFDQRPDSVIAYFSALLGGAAPEGRPYRISTDRAIVESLAGVVRAHLRAGTTDRLPGLAPELTLLTLLPYSGSSAVGAAEMPAVTDAIA